jgi:broad-specificity NMP kinase
MKTFFITAVCGVGKSTVMAPLRERLGAGFEVHDFDERGVPAGADRAWRLAETRHWLDVGRANAARGVGTVICGFARPSELVGAPDAACLLLDADEATLRQRLAGRYVTPESVAEIARASGGKSVEQFIQENVNFLPVLREECRAAGVAVVQTTGLTPAEVAEKVAAIISQEGIHAAS